MSYYRLDHIDLSTRIELGLQMLHHLVLGGRYQPWPGSTVCHASFSINSAAKREMHWKPPWKANQQDAGRK